MSDTVIQIEGLWKEYRLGVIGHGTLTRDLQSWWAKLRGKEDPNSKIQPMLAGQEKQIEGDRFWALRDINLEVKEGEILGIIGRNGAGKSTLLKLLSRVTAPTKGQIKIKGRIASLLEVGTGFHPELTGRENIFMNGAILGMSKQEIKNKLDEIIDFSGVEKFIDTPVKRYSSGMYVRLAFAVAAHLEPEILVIDEVLAVGDAEFQKKCLGKMEEASKAGRTVLFVSHHMEMIESLCQRGVMLDSGNIDFEDDDVKKVIKKYLYGSEHGFTTTSEWVNLENNYKNPYFKPLRFWLSGVGGEILKMPVSNDQDICVNLIFNTEELEPSLQICCEIYDMNHRAIFMTSYHDVKEEHWKEIKIGENNLCFKMPKRLLNKGKYRIELYAFLHHRMRLIQRGKECINLFFEIDSVWNNSPYWFGSRYGVIVPILRWK